MSPVGVDAVDVVAAGDDLAEDLAGDGAGALVVEGGDVLGAVGRVVVEGGVAEGDGGGGVPEIQGQGAIELGGDRGDQKPRKGAPRKKPT